MLDLFKRGFNMQNCIFSGDFNGPKKCINCNRVVNIKQHPHLIKANCGKKTLDNSTAVINLDIEPEVTKKAAQVLLNADPELRAWFGQVMKQGQKTGVARSWGGARQVYYWADGFAKPPLNEMRNFPLQAGGADLYNLTIVEICEKVQEAKFVYGMHDSMWFSVPVNRWTELYPRIRDLATQPRLINGRMIPFPATFKMMDDTGKVTKL